MNNFDIILLIFIAYFTIRGIFRGLIKELIIILALVLGYMIAFALYEQGSIILIKTFNGFPEAGAKILSFTLIFLAVNVALRLLGTFLEKIIKFAFLQPLNRLGGALFGLLKSLFFLSIIIFIIRLLPYAPQILQKAGAGKSVLWPYIIYFSTYVYQILLSIFPTGIMEHGVHQLMNGADSTVFKLLTH